MLRIKKKELKKTGWYYTMAYDGDIDESMCGLVDGIDYLVNMVPDMGENRRYVDKLAPAFAGYVNFRFEKVYTPCRGVYFYVYVHRLEKEYALPGDIIDTWKHNLVSEMIFGYEGGFLEIRERGTEAAFGKLRDWLYVNFGANARRTLWTTFEERLKNKVIKRWNTFEDFRNEAEREFKCGSHYLTEMFGAQRAADEYCKQYAYLWD